MPLEIPVLDNRSFEQLVAEGRSLIPRYSPQWTNHNPSDPGIALLELFAWLTEAAIFQADQVAPETIERFLDLLGAPRAVTAEGPERLDAAVARALRELRANERAITTADHMALARRIGGDRVPRAEYVAVEEPVFRNRLGHRVTWARNRRDGRRIEAMGGIDGSGRPWAATEEQVVAAVGAVEEDEKAGRVPDERARYYVEEPTGDPAWLEVARREDTTYVKTKADDDLPNNLLSLPSWPDPGFVSEPLDASTVAAYVRPGHVEPRHAGEPAEVGMLIIVPPGAAAGETPDQDLLDAVFAEVRRLRPLTARVHVVPPRWVRVRLVVEVARRPGTGLAAQAVRRLLSRFLDPLEGGEAGTGWPFGRDVYRSELYQVLEEDPEIDHVVRLEFGDTEPDKRAGRDSVRLEPTELVRVERADLDVTVSEA